MLETSRRSSNLLDHPKVGYRLNNYVDKPDFNMNDLVQLVRQALPVKSASLALMSRIRLPYELGMWAGHGCDVLAKVTGRQFPISAVRVQNFVQPHNSLRKSSKRQVCSSLPCNRVWSDPSGRIFVSDLSCCSSVSTNSAGAEVG